MFSLRFILIVFLITASVANASDNQEVIRGWISKVTVNNANNVLPGLSVCVLDENATSQHEICLWRKYNSINYNQLLDTANMAIMANKPIEIRANIVGDLDSITLLNTVAK